MAIIINKTAFLDAPISVESLHGVVFSNENKGHKFVITGIRGGELQTLVAVSLARDCYNVPGRFQLAVFVTSGGETSCIYAAVGTVQRSENGTLIDDGVALPSVDELQSMLDEIQQYETNIATAGAAQIAAVQAKGEETLDSIPDDYTALQGEVDDLKSAMYNVFDDATWQLVYIDETDGKTWTSNNKYLTCLRIPVKAGQIITVNANSTYGSRVKAYFYDTDYEFLNVSQEYVRDANETTSITASNDGYVRLRFQSYSQNTLTDALQAVYKALPILYISTETLFDMASANATSIGTINTTVSTMGDVLDDTTATANQASSDIETIHGYMDDLLPTMKMTLTGTIVNGFYNTGNNAFTESTNFDTLIVDYDAYALDWLYSGNVPNQLTAAATFINANNGVIGYALQGTSAGNVSYTDKTIGIIPEGTAKIAFTTYNKTKALTVKKLVYGLAYANKKFVIQGDSIETESAGKWPVMLKNAITFKSYTNCAVGGTCIAAVGSNYISSDSRMALMPETADIVLVGGGTNDWGNNVPMGSLNDLSSNANFAGAVYSLITKLQTKYPSAYIIFMSNHTGCSPNRTGFDDPSGWINNLGYTMSDYAEMLESVCKFAAIPYIDVNHACGINRMNYTLYNLQETNQNNDTVYVHPNEAGAKRIFRVIYNWLRNNTPTE